MFNSRLVKLFVGLAIVAVAVLSIGAPISAWQVARSKSDNRLAPLEWYFAHDHAVLDGDNNVVSSQERPVDTRWAPLEWYFAHDHAVLDGDNNVVSSGENLVHNRLAPLEWYFAHDHAVLDGDNNVVLRPVR